MSPESRTESRSRAFPRSVNPTISVPETIPTQISDARLTAISKTWSGAEIEEPAMMISVYPASMAAYAAKFRSSVETSEHAEAQTTIPKRNPTRSWGNTAVSMTAATAPTAVPNSRNAPLSSADPTAGWDTMAAVVPAHDGVSS